MKKERKKHTPSAQTTALQSPCHYMYQRFETLRFCALICIVCCCKYWRALNFFNAPQYLLSRYWCRAKSLACELTGRGGFRLVAEDWKIRELIMTVLRSLYGRASIEGPVKLRLNEWWLGHLGVTLEGLSDLRVLQTSSREKGNPEMLS